MEDISWRHITQRLVVPAEVVVFNEVGDGLLQTGLLSTEDIVVMLDEMGVEHGLDVDKVLEAGRVIERIFGQRLHSQCITSGRIPKGPTGF